MRLWRGWRRGRRAKVGAVGGVVVVGVEREFTQFSWWREIGGASTAARLPARASARAVAARAVTVTVPIPALAIAAVGQAVRLVRWRVGFVRGSAGRWVARASEDDLSAAGLSGGSGSHSVTPLVATTWACSGLARTVGWVGGCLHSGWGVRVERGESAPTHVDVFD